MKAIDALKSLLVAEITTSQPQLVSLSTGSKDIKDESGLPTGEHEHFVKVEVEIPKKCGVLSKLRFEVKIVNGILKVTDSDILEKDYLVEFKNLEISYLDNRNVYLRAFDYELMEV